MLYCLLQADNDMDIMKFALETGEPMPPLRRWMELQLCTNSTLAGMQACLPPGDAPTCQLMPNTEHSQNSTPPPPLPAL